MSPPAFSVAIPATLDNTTCEAGHDSLRAAVLPPSLTSADSCSNRQCLPALPPHSRHDYALSLRNNLRVINAKSISCRALGRQDYAFNAAKICFKAQLLLVESSLMAGPSNIQCLLQSRELVDAHLSLNIAGTIQPLTGISGKRWPRSIRGDSSASLEVTISYIDAQGHRLGHTHRSGPA
jgi:hypothetical protein